MSEKAPSLDRIHQVELTHQERIMNAIKAFQVKGDMSLYNSLTDGERLAFIENCKPTE